MDPRQNWRTTDGILSTESTHDIHLSSPFGMSARTRRLVGMLARIGTIHSLSLFGKHTIIDHHLTLQEHSFPPARSDSPIGFHPVVGFICFVRLSITHSIEFPDYTRILLYQIMHLAFSPFAVLCGIITNGPWYFDEQHLILR